MASTEEKDLEQIQDQEENEVEAYNDLFEQFAEGKEPEAAEEEEEEASTSESESAPSDKDRTDGDDESPEDGKGEEAQDDKPEDPYAWIDALPEEFRSNAESLRHQYDSERNRSMSFQNRYEKLRAEKLARERVAASKGAASDSGQAANQESKTSSKELTPELKEYAEQYPKLFEMMQAVVAQNTPRGTDEFAEKLEAIESKLTASEMLTAQQEFDREFQELFQGTEYTDVSQVTKSEGFNAWVEQHPEDIQHDIRTTNDYGRALWYLKNFVKDVELEYMKSGAAQQEGSSSKSAASKRKEKLRKSVTPDSRGAGVEGTPSGSYEDYFDEFAS